MKTPFYLTLLFFLTCTCFAQAQPDSTSVPDQRFYVGTELSSINYLIANYDAQVGGMFTPLAHLHVGYRLSKRASVQLGFAYGGTRDNFESVYYKSSDSTIYRSFQIDNQGLAMPLTLQYTPFNPNRRLNFFATASLVTVIGEAHQRHTETMDGKTEVLFDGHESGVYLLATAGVVLNYKISRRLEGYGKANLLYKDVGNYSDYAKQAWSLAIGLNYNL